MRPLLFTAAIAGALASGACNAIVGPSSPDSNWRVLDRGRFAFYVRPGSFAEQNVDTFQAVLEDQYDHTVQLLHIRYAGRISVFLYDSAADAHLESDRSGTAYPDTEAVRAVCTAPLDENLYLVLAHETNHVIIRNGFGRPGTSFVTEGIASAVLSERYHQLGRHFLFDWTRRETAKIPPISSLADDSKWTSFATNVAYNASASFLAYLLDTYGPDRLRQLYPASSDTFGSRFEQVYGRSLAQAEADWKQFCAEWAG